MSHQIICKKDSIKKAPCLRKELIYLMLCLKEIVQYLRKWKVSKETSRSEHFADVFAPVTVSNDLNVAVYLMLCMLKEANITSKSSRVYEFYCSEDKWEPCVPHPRCLQGCFWEYPLCTLTSKEGLQTLHTT